jgi:hypothetical protein
VDSIYVKGELVHIIKEFMNVATIMNEEFQLFHAEGLSKESGVINKVEQQILSKLDNNVN